MKVLNNRGYIRLDFAIDKQRYSFAPIKRGKYADPLDLARAQEIARRINSDIKSGDFDDTLSRYLPKPAVKNEKITGDIKLLWRKYTAFKKPDLAPSTLKTEYERRVGNALALLPTTAIKDMAVIRDWLIKQKPVTQAKKILGYLKSCLQWALDLDLIKVNPLAGALGKIKGKRKNHEADINPFTAEERDRICRAFTDSQQYHHYSYLIRFLFATGCRPCEALALKWSDIKADKLVFQTSYVMGEERDGLKTQDKRIILLNQPIKLLIKEIKDYHSKIKNNRRNLVFPAVKGGFLDWHNFATRPWKKILESLKDIDYRNPYQCRHTTITLALQNGVNIKDLANFCGNSPRIILERYAGITRGFVMPENLCPTL